MKRNLIIAAVVALAVGLVVIGWFSAHNNPGQPRSDGSGSGAAISIFLILFVVLLANRSKKNGSGEDG